ncbi:uncharacterized protein SPSK_06721 [Sporothrix schenckii 1099-18]|uniref:Uncharacterized protein n=2 Tax=Sporothrix schenckii TaxID=29908 RepID=U7PUU0_SPOS1|nr:uncharacterized protein SPSK_06721 [Sporothrix schenckii 1099-18]ERS98250.1 hypothetical protein HMPREF1624_05033 [Sporothrix schenckii ATCC 58251]KJR89643.1 hypothetical protein SPSK_06721 [Sporothrix schenckii 1099-18]
MCKWICRHYDCDHKKYIVSSFCQRYIKSRGRICHAIGHVYYDENYLGELCPQCRNVMTDNHREYMFKIYKDLNKKHPDRNWDKVVAAARFPTNNTQARTVQLHYRAVQLW